MEAVDISRMFTQRIAVLFVPPQKSNGCLLQLEESEGQGEGVSAVRDNELKLENVQVSLTLGDAMAKLGIHRRPYRLQPVWLAL